MTDIVSAPLIGVTAGGITIIGVATGLDPVLLGAGACGGWWAQSYLNKPLPWPVRLNNIAISCVFAAWSAAFFASEACRVGWVSESGEKIFGYISAIVLGFMALPILGLLIMDIGSAARRWVRAKLDRVLDKIGGIQ